jgi:hypothetical protein
MSQTTSSSQIVSLFENRIDSTGKMMLSVKQTAWLAGQMEREGLHTPSNRHAVNVRSTSGQWYEFSRFPNGAGFLRVNNE